MSITGRSYYMSYVIFTVISTFSGWGRFQLATYLCSVRPTKRLHRHIKTFQQHLSSHFILIYKCLVYSFNFFLAKWEEKKEEIITSTVIHGCSVPQFYYITFLHCFSVFTTCTGPRAFFSKGSPTWLGGTLLTASFSYEKWTTCRCVYYESINEHWKCRSNSRYNTLNHTDKSRNMYNYIPSHTCLDWTCWQYILHFIITCSCPNHSNQTKHSYPGIQTGDVNSWPPRIFLPGFAFLSVILRFRRHLEPEPAQ